MGRLTQIGPTNCLYHRLACYVSDNYSGISLILLDVGSSLGSDDIYIIVSHV